MTSDLQNNFAQGNLVSENNALERAALLVSACGDIDTAFLWLQFLIDIGVCDHAEAWNMLTPYFQASIQVQS